MAVAQALLDRRRIWLLNRAWGAQASVTQRGRGVRNRHQNYAHQRPCPVKDEVRTNLRLLDEQAKTQRTVADTITALHK